MTVRAVNFAQKSARFQKAVDKSYYPAVTSYVLANLVLGLADPSISTTATISIPYQYRLILGFNKKGNKLRTTTATRIRRLATSFGKASGGSASAAAAGVQIKPNGFPDFTPFQHPFGALVFLPGGLSGSRYWDEKKANDLTGRGVSGTPSGYVWHHHEIPGIMQLVERSKHNTFEKGAAHDGGALFWSILTDKDYK